MIDMANQKNLKVHLILGMNISDCMVYSLHCLTNNLPRRFLDP